MLIDTLSRWTARIVAAALLLPAAAHSGAPAIEWQLVAEHPHTASDFTQGLVWDRGRMFESAGNYGASRIAEKSLASGKALKARPQPAREFGEGLALHAGTLWQFTWREGVVNRYGLSLTPEGGFCIGAEVWGATSDGAALILSNGSDTLFWAEPLPFGVTRRLPVRDAGQPVARLNELEWVDGLVYANVWMTDRVARIDAASGEVTGWLDLSALKEKAGITPAREAEGAVLNGLAWRPETGTLLVTGKWWPKLYEIKLLPAR